MTDGLGYTKLCAGVSSLLILYLLFILVVLKSDGYTSVARWPWGSILLPLLSVCAFFVGIWVLIHYFFSFQLPALDRLLRSKLDDGGLSAIRDQARKFLLRVDTQTLMLYYEAHAFRAFMLMLLYAIFIGLAALVSRTPCHGCNTPYHLLSYGAITCYGLRFLLVFISSQIENRRTKLLMSELRHFQSSCDEERFFRRALPDLKGHSTGFNFFSVIFFVSTLLFAALGVAWIVEGDCKHICPRQVDSNKNYFYGLSVFELAYLASAVVDRYLCRTMGVEAVDFIINSLLQLYKRADDGEFDDLGVTGSPATSGGGKGGTKK